MLEVAVFTLVLAANAAPLLARLVLDGRWQIPIDGGRQFAGQPLLGSTKTWRGLLAGIFLPALLAPAFGIDWLAGALIGAAALSGDLLSSLIKRRRKLPPSAPFWPLDQIPESLFPALLAIPLLGLSGPGAVAVALVFVLLAPLISRLLHRLGLRHQPW